jgi:transcriptional regulator with XRE-family HTH domain
MLDDLTNMLVNKINTLEQTFGHILREARKSQGISQETLALESGVDRNFVSLLERGKNQPTLGTIFKLAKALDTKPSSLVTSVEHLLDKQLNLLAKK